MGRYCRGWSPDNISDKNVFNELGKLYAGTIFGMRKEKNPSFGFSLSIFSKAHSTADRIPPNRLVSSPGRKFLHLLDALRVQSTLLKR